MSKQWRRHPKGSGHEDMLDPEWVVMDDEIERNQIEHYKALERLEAEEAERQSRERDLEELERERGRRWRT